MGRKDLGKFWGDAGPCSFDCDVGLFYVNNTTVNLSYFILFYFLKASRAGKAGCQNEETLKARLRGGNERG